MGSKQTYECFTCKNNGFPAVMVYLAGKDAQGRAIRLEEDGTTPHTHKTKVPSQQLQQQEVPNSDLLLQMKLLRQKMDKIITLMEIQNQNQNRN